MVASLSTANSRSGRRAGRRAFAVPCEQITRYGESDWILIPAGALLLLTALVAVFVRWKLMRTLLWQFAALYGFILVGVGLPEPHRNARSSASSAVGARVLRPVRHAELPAQLARLDLPELSRPGHATTAFALAAVIGFVSPRWFYPGLVFAAAVGVSRVSLGVHYASDVVAGAILGLLGAYVVRLSSRGAAGCSRSTPNGGIRARPMSSLRRYLTLKRRGSAPAPQPSRP